MSIFFIYNTQNSCILKTMRHEGIPKRKKLCNELKAFSTLTAIMKGEPVYQYKRRERKTSVRKAKNDMEEKELEKDIILMLRMIGYDAYKTGETSMSNSNFCEVGVADITVKGKGFKIFYLEVKVQGRKQNENQIKAQARCKKQGINYFVVESKKDVLKALDIMQKIC